MSSGDSPTAEFDPTSKPDKKACTDEKWAYLQKAVAYIMGHPEGIAGLGPAAIYMHTAVFDFCHSGNGLQLLAPNSPPHLRKPGPPLPEQLNERLVGFLESYFEEIYQSFESLHGLDLLTHYGAQFDQASASARHLNRVFDYFNRQRVCHNPNPKHFGKYEGVKIPTKWIITAKATLFDVWKNAILARLQQDSSKFTSALLDIIHQQPENKGEENATLVKKILESLITLDDNLTNPIQQSTLYQDHFQSRFLSDCDSFCLSKQTEIHLSADEKAGDPSVQLKGALQLETDRMAKYLPECTQKELLARVERAKCTKDKNISL